MHALDVRVDYLSLDVECVVYFDTLGNEIVSRSPHMAYDYYPRANIFRRDQSKVQQLGDIQKILRYNNWQHDAYSLGDPGNQISSRFDLEPTVRY